VPRAQHDTPRRCAVEIELVHTRAMRVAVNQQSHAAGAHGGRHRGGLDVHDVGGGAAGVATAAVAGPLRETAPHAQGQFEEAPLPARIPHQGAQHLVGAIGRAERITVREQGALAVEIDEHRIDEQSRAAARLEAPLQQEIAIAMHDIAGHTARREPTQRIADQRPAGLRVIIADPRLEQIAENVERFGARRTLLEKGDELRASGGLERIQVQIGDEQGGHAYRSALAI